MLLENLKSSIKGLLDRFWASIIDLWEVCMGRYSIGRMLEVTERLSDLLSIKRDRGYNTTDEYKEMADLYDELAIMSSKSKIYSIRSNATLWQKMSAGIKKKVLGYENTEQ